ncbi:acyl carrier protein [Phytohabitans aurantiacus]|jgi:acyl carrier protein|uniref:Carrier domain-containing protein n=1 Tax=Phytohabitans aurantiacus TaxID=3016789 RepID=A0ABQ5QWX8_9ACTN|nr:acyl carrier protein [Phytohabitans aurantiacus]GLH98151.1 hypothetical protein Pa4123_34260 [Phytohabitans aurantiacus]
MTDRSELRQSVATLISEATAGAVPATEALAGGVALYDLGLDSLGWLRLIDAVESAYGVELDLGTTDLRSLTIDQIIAHLPPTAS